MTQAYGMLELCCLLCFQICRLHSADFGLNIRAQMLLAAFPQCRGGVNAILLWTVKVLVLLFIYSGRQKSVSKTSPCLAEQFVCDDSSI